MIKTVAWAAGLLLVASAAMADPATHPGISVRDAWSRPAAAGTNGAGFFTIRNSGTSPDTLLSVSSRDARKVEMHQTVMSDGVMSMLRLDSGVMLAPGQSLTFEPGGRHLMLLDIKSALRVGDTLPLTFHLASGRRLDVQAPVRLSPPDKSRAK